MLFFKLITFMFWIRVLDFLSCTATRTLFTLNTFFVIRCWQKRRKRKFPCFVFKREQHTLNDDRVIRKRIWSTKKVSVRNLRRENWREFEPKWVNFLFYCSGLYAGKIVFFLNRIFIGWIHSYSRIADAQFFLILKRYFNHLFWWTVSYFISLKYF